jgi:hypothetical protein
LTRGPALRCAAAWLALALPAFGASARHADDSKAKADESKTDQDDSPTTAWTPRPIFLVAKEVIKRRLLEAPSDTAQRISVKGGLVGLGAYNPRGSADLGMYAPPRDLFSRVGLGNSLNVDPNTGRSYFTNTP